MSYPANRGPATNRQNTGLITSDTCPDNMQFNCGDVMKAAVTKAAMIPALFVAVLSGPVWAQPLQGLDGIAKEASTGQESFIAQPGVAQPGVAQPGINLREATAIARKHTGGKVLSANPRQRGAVMEYRVRMLVDGARVVTVTVDNHGQVRERR